MDNTIRIAFDKNGDAIIDAHDKYGNHIKGTEEFTMKLASQLGKIEERHEGGSIHLTKTTIDNIIKVR